MQFIEWREGTRKMLERPCPALPGATWMTIRGSPTHWYSPSQLTSRSRVRYCVRKCSCVEQLVESAGVAEKAAVFLCNVI